jgi:hypothetical protein
MKVRRLLVVAVGMFLATALAWFFWLAPRNHRISADSYNQLAIGMAENEVEAILGGPSGDYGPGTGQLVNPALVILNTVERSRPHRQERWMAGTLAITVWFNENGLVLAMARGEVYRPYDSRLEMIGQLLGICEKKPHPGTFPLSISDADFTEGP